MINNITRFIGDFKLFVSFIISTKIYLFKKFLRKYCVCGYMVNMLRVDSPVYIQVYSF